MEQLARELIGALKQAIHFIEIRNDSLIREYLEAVLPRQDLDACCALLQQYLGPAIKNFGESAQLESVLAQAVETLGGIRPEQCLFVERHAAQRAAYAALWPWASDAAKITLKVGVVILTS